MEALDYVEQRTTRTLEVLRKSYDDLHERAYKFATVLVAGGGAAGGYALGKFSPQAEPMAWAPLAALALSWFGVAAYLILKGTTSASLSPGNGPKNLLGTFDGWSAHLGDDGQALEKTRREELSLEQRRIREYSDGCVTRAESIDLAYKMAAFCSPAVPAAVSVFCVVR